MWYIEAIESRANAQMKPRTVTIILLTVLIALSLPKPELPSANAIGVANVIVQTVYWGTDPTAPQSVHPGDTNVIMSIVLANVGDDVARNVTATVYFTPPIDYTYFINGVANTSSSVTKVAGDMNAGDTFTLTYTVSVEPSAQAAVYHYNILLSYKSARELQQVNKTAVMDVPITKGELHIQSVSTNPVKIYPDSYGNTVTVTIVNSGNGLAKDVQVDLQLTAPFTPSSSGSDEIFLGNLPAGQTTPANFVIDVNPNATFGQYSIPLVEALGNQLIPIGQVPVYVAEKVKFQIISVSPTTVSPGDSGDVISVEIKNIGSITAESVRVELQVGNYFTGTLTDFLGDMTTGQNKTALFTVDIDSKAPVGTYPVGLRFDWTQDNNQYALNHTYPVTLYVQAAGPPYALIAVLVVVIIGVGYFIRKKKLAKAKPTATK